MSVFGPNPFARRRSRRRDNILSDPRITVEMLVDFVGECDAFELRLFVLLILNGLRMSELLFLFKHQIRDHWLEVRRHEELCYSPKSYIGRELPLLEVTRRILTCRRPSNLDELVFLRRHAESTSRPTWSRSKSSLVAEFEARCRRYHTVKVADRMKARNEVMRQAGGLSPKAISAAFKKIHHRLDWPAGATVHQLRHTFATALDDAGVPDSYRRLLLGHAPDRSVTATYTHSTRKRMREFYEDALRTELKPLVSAIEARAFELGLLPGVAESDQKILRMLPDVDSLDTHKQPPEAAERE